MKSRFLAWLGMTMETLGQPATLPVKKVRKSPAWRGRFIGFLCVLCVSVVSPASAQTTITGTIKDASGTALTSGTIIFTLSQEGTVTDPALLVVQPVVTCTITNGVIGTCSLRGNDEISPAGTFYRVRIISSGGRTFLPERTYSITGATWDIGTATPLASDTVAATAYQIVQDEGTNLAQRQKLNFTGAGVSCVDNSTDARTDCTIPSGGGGSAQIVREVDGTPSVSAAAIEEFDQTAGFVVSEPVSGTARITLSAVPDSVLASISTAGKVSGAALTSLGSVPAGAGDLPLANLTDGTGFLKGAGGAGTPAYTAIADGDLPASIARDSELHAQSHVLDGADHTVSSLTVGNYLRALTASTFGFSVILDGDLPAAIARDSELHAQSHVLAGSDHTASGLTAGQVLRATGASTFAWQAIQPSDLGAAYFDALGDLAAGLCGTGEILEDQGGSWACIATPASGGAHNILSTTHTDAVTASVVLGDLLYGDATPNWNRLVGTTTTTKQFLTQTGNGTVSAAPAWGTIAAGDLPSAYIDALGDFLGTLCGTNEILEDQGASWACIATPSGANHNILSATHSDTTAATVVRGDLMVGQTATPVWQRLAIGGANTFLGSDGTDATWIGLVLAGAQFANQGSTTQVLHGNAAGNPSWAAVSLTADVSGVLPGANGGTNNAFMDFTGPATSLKTFTLPNASSTILTTDAAVTVAQGGTGLTSGTSGGILGFTATGTLASSALLTTNALVLGGGAGATPSTPVGLGTTTQVLHGNAAGSPTFGQVVPADINDGGAASTFAFFSGAGGDPSFRAIADGDLPSGLTRDTESPNAAGDISGTYSAGLTIDAGAVASAELATANKTFKCNFVLFDDTGLKDTDDINSISNCSRPGRAITITEVHCETDAGSPVINLQRDDGTPANILSSNLTCTTGGANGTIAAAEDNIAATDKIDFVAVSGMSGANRISVLLEYTVD